MEIMQIKDCQEVLDSVLEITTEEERKCVQLLRNPKTIKWLDERKSNLDKEIKEIEGKILDKGGILSKKKAKESEKEKINNELESKTNNLNSIKLQESLKSKISEVEKKIKEYESDIYDKGQSKNKVDEEIKNKETNVRYWESEVKTAISALSSAEGKILDKGGILSKKKAKESEKEKISKILESKTNNLNNIKVAESDKKLQESLKSKISEVEKKIKEYELDIYEKGQSKNKVDEEIKNKESNVRYWESEVSSATSRLSSAEIELSTSQNRYSSNSCWGGRSPELSYSCVERYRKKVEDNKTTKESKERDLNNAKKALNEEREKSKKLSEDIVSLNTKKNQELINKAQYTKEKQEVEARMEGVLEHKKSLETDIEAQKAEQIKINDELLSLEESAKNFDSNALETQRGVLEQEFQDAASIRHWVFKYQTTEIPREIQHEEL